MEIHSLSNPKFKDKENLRTYDYVVANPPFSDKTWITGLTPSNDSFQRFQWGEPPTKQGDYAYLLHIIRSLKSTGKGACILPHGVLFRGNAEAVIRKNLVKSGILKGIIGLPANLFYGTGIPACVLVLDKENAKTRKGIFMIDASKGFIKDGNKNRLREQDIHKIVDSFTNYKEISKFSRMVPLDEIASPKNDYNLNLPRYIDSTDVEDIQDIDAHLNGGIPARDVDALSEYWEVFPSAKKSLFKAGTRSGYYSLKVEGSTVKETILKNPEFETYRESIQKIYDQWKKNTIPQLKGFGEGGKPKELITTISESLLHKFRTAPLIDEYDVYQHLMDYWNETMQDDCYLIASDGWKAETRKVYEVVKAGKDKGTEKEKGWTCDLLPKPFIVAKYFKKEQEEIENLKSEVETIGAEMEELKEEHGGEEGILKDVSSKSDAQIAYREAISLAWNEDDKKGYAEYLALLEKAEAYETELNTLTDNQYISVLKNKNGKLSLKDVKDRLAESTKKEEKAKLSAYLSAESNQRESTKQANVLFKAIEEKYKSDLEKKPIPELLKDFTIVVRFQDLLEQQSKLKTEIKTKEEELDTKAFNKYPELTVDEIKTLVVDDKWMSTISSEIESESERVSQTLATRIRELVERYEYPLLKLESEVSEFSKRVEAHLKKMGLQWE